MKSSNTMRDVCLSVFFLLLFSSADLHFSFHYPYKKCWMQNPKPHVQFYRLHGIQIQISSSPFSRTKAKRISEWDRLKTNQQNERQDNDCNHCKKIRILIKIKIVFCKSNIKSVTWCCETNHEMLTIIFIFLYSQFTIQIQ